MKNLCVVVPVFNDWSSLNVLLRRMDQLSKSLSPEIFVTVVDDGSTESANAALQDLTSLTNLHGVEIVHLAANVGHQRAIAIGLCVAVADHDMDAILVMDGDGEDPPEEIATLLRQAGTRQDFCIVAQRRKRHEDLTFRLSYIAYKTVFRVVTGKKINFGNFSLSSRGYARRLVMISDLWNNLAAALLRSRLPIEMVPIDRGTRYAGTSKMNYVSLILHGLSGMSVYAETILVRLMLLTFGLVTLSVVLIATVLSLRVFAPLYATPGWATTVTFGIVIIFLQVLFTTLSSILILLNSRVQRQTLPYVDYKPYVASRELIVGRYPTTIPAS